MEETLLKLAEQLGDNAQTVIIWFLIVKYLSTLTVAVATVAGVIIGGKTIARLIMAGCKLGDYTPDKIAAAKLLDDV